MSENAPSHRLFGITFGFYNCEEIKKLSVKEITNPTSFDSLGHPTYGGPYDPALGPSEKNDVCSTCGLNSIYCPGHFGHISLPLPVYNPLLFRTLFLLLKGSCMQCHMMRVEQGRGYLLQKQMELLDSGILTDASHLENVFHGVMEEIGGSEVGNFEIIKQRLDETVLLTNLNNKYAENEVLCDTKHITNMKQKIMKEFLAGGFYKKSTCPHCHTPVRALRNEQFSKIFHSQGMKKSQAMKLLLKKDQLQKAKREGENTDETPEIDEVEMENGVAASEKSEKDMEKELASLMEQGYLTQTKIKEHLRAVWQNEGDLLKCILGALKIQCKTDDMKFPTDIFFIDILPVPPPKFRPIAVLNDQKYDNTQTANLAHVIADSQLIKEILYKQKQQEKDDNITELLNNNKDDIENEKSEVMKTLLKLWTRLQVNVNCVVDSDLDKYTNNRQPGIRQLIEKKDGLFRKNMMGKRVNFAARSVISPDPYINTNEIGIPDIFAKRLTYPQPVTPWNFQELKQAVINGPNVYPGACYVINEDGKQVLLSKKDQTQREAIAKQLLAPSAHASGNSANKKVLRHLKNGDVLLLNRQPTLHKPSIQAHKARILPGEKTLRLHYSNCKAYNADFDGDEMNAHFPQNEIARAEAYTIASTDYQYLVPKDGTPLAGLIQDHIIGGVNLTIRGRFFDKHDYQMLVYDGLTDKRGPIKLLPPSILKPKVLWSGKQVLSTLILNIIPPNKSPITLQSSAKVNIKNWQSNDSRVWLAGGTALEGVAMSESEVVIRQGELLVGVLDKAHYGPTPYGLVHSCFELYGGEIAGKLLTAFAKLFTKVLQFVGFTLGVEDILCNSKPDSQRRKAMARGSKSGPKVAAKALRVRDHKDSHSLFKRMQEAHFCNNGAELKDLDLSMKGQTDEIQNQVAKSVMPIGLMKKFPKNNLQLMVQAGAKGSAVNCMQISCLLGQIELEGRRPPLMMSGRFLPSFIPYDPSPRAGGFVDGRFLTGIRPQEYFFHCMAGREGLVDTAVKTSRSGYLQRCIIKHLEGIVVNYDMTVRDSDGSVVQFQYGEDSSDIMKYQFLKPKTFPFLVHNKNAVIKTAEVNDIKSKIDVEKAPHAWKKVKKWENKVCKVTKQRNSGFLRYCEKNYGTVLQEVGTSTELVNGRSLVANQLCDNWKNMTPEEKYKYCKKHTIKTVDPVVTSLSPHCHFGAITEHLDKLITNYTNTHISDDQVTDKTFHKENDSITKEQFRELLYYKSVKSQVHPGESVGLLAAQSIGEPSTQMTLNTFHFAGRGEMNVTLGIPRLREILCIASENIKTPSMDIPLLKTPEASDKALELKLNLTKVMLHQVLESVSVTETLSVKIRSEKCRLYKMRFNFLPYEMYMHDFSVNPSKIINYMEQKFFKNFQEVIKRKINELDKVSVISSGIVRNKAAEVPNTNANTEGGNDAAEDVEDDEQHDGDATSARVRDRQLDDNDYQGEDDDKREVHDVDEEENSGVDSDEDNADAAEDSDSDDSAPEAGRPSTPDLQETHHTNIQQLMDVRRINNVFSNVSVAKKYEYDPLNELWCELTIGLSLGDKKLDMASLIESEAKKSVVYCKDRISRAFLVDSKVPGYEGTHLKTEGCNIHEMYKYDKILDVNRLYTNDVMSLMRTYGIEAAGKALIKEMRDVFAAYGIEVDYHHLSLIADYMTFEGTYKPFNRMALETNSSPLQKMTFETTMNFLKSATLQGATDNLNSPSSRIVVGKVVAGGTGCFEVLQPLVH